jgi:hypothetical protein
MTGWLQLADADAQCREYRMHNHQLQAMNAKLRKEALSLPRPSAAARHMADADWCVLGLHPHRCTQRTVKAHAPSRVRVRVQPSDCGGQVAHAKETLEAQQRRHRPDGADSAYHAILGEAELGQMRPPGTRPSTVAGATRSRSVRAGAHAEVPHALGEQLGAPAGFRGPSSPRCGALHVV